VADAPVMAISGFAHPTNKFAAPHRVIDWHACNGCWKDVRHRFDYKDCLWCPQHADTPRQSKRTRLITTTQVTAILWRVHRLVDPVATSLSTPQPAVEAAKGVRS